jgi:prepilin-type N-terminal cleavage/methylation domain-containing protein
MPNCEPTGARDGTAVKIGAMGARRGERGFTLIELMAVVGILLIVTVVGFPAFQNWLDQQRLMAFVRDASVELVRARQEAIQRGVPVIAQPNYDERMLFVWADVDSNRAFNPDATKPNRTTDYEIGRIYLATQSEVHFHGAGDANPYGADALAGLTPMPSGSNAYVFEPDGSIRHVGGVRVADERGNFFELRAAPKATGKIRVMKYNSGPSWGDAAGYFEQGNVPSTGKPLWVWY